MPRTLRHLLCYTMVMAVFLVWIGAVCAEPLAQSPAAGDGVYDVYRTANPSWLPEPTTLLMWVSMAGLAAMLYFRRRFREN